MHNSTIAGIAAGAGVLAIIGSLWLLYKFDHAILQRRATAQEQKARRAALADTDDIAREEAITPKLMALLGEPEPTWVQWSLTTLLEHGEMPSYITASLPDGCRASDVLVRINMERDRRPDKLAQRFRQPAPQHSAV